jgi:uncharacterized protein YggU (UPF0235/DUF167 family)
MRIAVIARPHARRERVELTDDTLSVWVRARPVAGQANAAIEEAIARALGLRSSQVRLVAGTTSRHKLAEIDVADLADLRARLRDG